MNITELTPKDRVLVLSRPAEGQKEVATVQAVLDDGRVRVFPCGKRDAIIVTPEQILKIFT